LGDIVVDSNLLRNEEVVRFCGWLAGWLLAIVCLLPCCSSGACCIAWLAGCLNNRTHIG